MPRPSHRAGERRRGGAAAAHARAVPAVLTASRSGARTACPSPLAYSPARLPSFAPAPRPRLLPARPLLAAVRSTAFTTSACASMAASTCGDTAPRSSTTSRSPPSSRTASSAYAQTSRNAHAAGATARSRAAEVQAWVQPQRGRFEGLPPPSAQPVGARGHMSYAQILPVRRVRALCTPLTRPLPLPPLPRRCTAVSRPRSIRSTRCA